METIFLQLLNYFFFAFHTALIFFNLFGWLFPKTKKLHLISLLITLFSWGVLGIWKGFGYCFLTDWHYQVLRKLGERDMPSSYISFLTEKFTGWLPNAVLADNLTLALTFLALLCTIWVNFFESGNNKQLSFLKVFKEKSKMIMKIYYNLIFYLFNLIF